MDVAVRDTYSLWHKACKASADRIRAMPPFTEKAEASPATWYLGTDRTFRVEYKAHASLYTKPPIVGTRPKWTVQYAKENKENKDTHTFLLSTETSDTGFDKCPDHAWWHCLYLKALFGDGECPLPQPGWAVPTFDFTNDICARLYQLALLFNSHDRAFRERWNR